MYNIDDRMINVHGEVEEMRIVRRKRRKKVLFHKCQLSPPQSLEMLISEAHVLEIGTASRHECFFYVRRTKRHGRAVSKSVSYSGGPRLKFHVLIFALPHTFRAIPKSNRAKPCVIKTKLRGLSPRANYTDRAIAAGRRSDCQLLRMKGAK
jgi:hypothetical protein